MRIPSAALVVSVALLAACSASSEDASFKGGGVGEPVGNENAGARPGPGTDAASAGPGASSSSSSGASSSTDEGTGAGAGAGGTQAQAGVLTAGVWDDNLNFDFFTKYLELSRTLDGLPSFGTTAREAARQKWLQRAAATELDVTFLIDTTGSMGDELSYLQTEVDDIAQTIAAKFPSTTPRYGLVLYKDLTDSYLTRQFDFDGIAKFRANLGAQTVGGGGDYPEAVQDGLEKTMDLGWRTGAVSRLVFWIADAPHHAADAARVQAAIEAAIQKDVHIYPVAASGTDPRAEHTMRTAAQLTGGRYVFLTDDSGVGGAHAEPHIPCYHVTKFNQAIVRMVESEMKGAHIAPIAGEVLRTVGSPKEGQCTTKAAGPVKIY